MAYGDHLCVRVEKSWFGLIHHHGIEVGGEQVIHYHKEHKWHIPVVKRTSKTMFADGATIEIVPHSLAFDPNVVVSLAERFLEKQEEYHLLTMNCEDMANFCKSGDCRSGQVEFVEALTACLGIAAVAFKSLKRA
jgi:Lecithin retinol acyltransferase